MDGLFLARYALPGDTDLNFSAGADRLFVYIAQQVPLFIPLTLFAFFMVIFLGGVFSQRRQEGRGDIAMWFSIAGYITSTVTLLMFLVDGLINLTTVMIVLSVTFGGALWFLTTKEQY